MRLITLTLHPSVDRVLSLPKWTSGEVQEMREAKIFAAGKGVNAARSLKSMLRGPAAKDSVQAAVWLGANEIPLFQTQLLGEGIQGAFCPRPVSTRLCLTMLKSGGNEIHLKETMASPLPGENRALLKFVRDLPLRGAGVAVCGSAPPRTSPALLRRLLWILRRRAAWVIADTNGSFQAAAGRAGLEGLKGNAEEIGAWLGLIKPLDPSNAAHRKKLREHLSPAGPGAPRAIMITLGSAGVLLATPEGLWQAQARRPLRRSIRSAVGCGDAATAGWMRALARNCPPQEAARWAAACGTAKLYQAEPGGLDRNLVEKLYRSAKVRCWS